MNAGVLLVAIAAALVFVAPAERVLAHRRWARWTRAELTWLQVYPIVAALPEFDALIVRIDAELAADPLARGTAGVGEVYDRAARG